MEAKNSGTADTTNRDPVVKKYAGVSTSECPLCGTNEPYGLAEDPWCSVCRGGILESGKHKGKSFRWVRKFDESYCHHVCSKTSVKNPNLLLFVGWLRSEANTKEPHKQTTEGKVVRPTPENTKLGGGSSVAFRRATALAARKSAKTMGEDAQTAPVCSQSALHSRESKQPEPAKGKTTKLWGLAAALGGATPAPEQPAAAGGQTMISSEQPAPSPQKPPPQGTTAPQDTTASRTTAAQNATVAQDTTAPEGTTGAQATTASPETPAASRQTTSPKEHFAVPRESRDEQQRFPDQFSILSPASSRGAVQRIRGVQADAQDTSSWPAPLTRNCGTARALVGESERKYVLPKATAEQSEAVRVFAESNLVVRSVAGSGKTTLILHLASEYPDMSFLVLTYNRHLKDETQEKVSALGLKNVTVRTFHSFAGDRVGRPGRVREDKEVEQTLSEPYAPFEWDVFVVDEVQDMVRPFYGLVVKAAGQRANTLSPLRWVLLGDARQCVYAFQGADFRYLELAHLIFPLGAFVPVRLTVSHRVTAENARLINAMCRDTHIRAARRGPKPKLVSCNLFRSRESLDRMIRELVARYSKDEVIVLAPHLKRPYSDLSNGLSGGQYGREIPVFVKTNEKSEAYGEAARGKMVFSSYNSAKGTERKVVVVLGFDDGLYRYNLKIKGEPIPTECPLPLYVALTRASEQLVLVEGNDADHRRFSFFPEPAADYCEIVNFDEGRGDRAPEKARPITKSVTELLRGKKPDFFEEAQRYFREKTLRPAAGEIAVNAQTEGKTPGTVEPVSDIIGVLVPLACACRLAPNSSHIYRGLAEAELRRCDAKSSRHRVLEMASRRLGVNWDVLDSRGAQIRAAVAIQASLSGSLERIFQIGNFAAVIDDATLDKLVTRLRGVVGDGEARVETPVSRVFSAALPSGDVVPVGVYGAVDWVAEAREGDTAVLRVYEIKCATKLTPADRLQLLLYAALLAPELETRFAAVRCEYFLYNVRSDELLQLSVTGDDLDRIASLVIRSQTAAISDEDFVSANLRLAEEIGA